MCTVIEGPEAINNYRKLMLRQALILEIKGMTRRGRSAYSIIKEEFKLTGSKTEVLKKYEELIGYKGE